MSDLKIGILVAARMSSKRLPGKHLKEISGKPVLSWLIQRILSEFSEEVDSDKVTISIITGNKNSNSGFESLAISNGIGIFYGDDRNIPLRQLQAARSMNIDGIISVDGDDILCAPESMRAVYSGLIDGNSYINTAGYPLGMNCSGYSTVTLSNALDFSESAILETGWGRIFDNIEKTCYKFECNGSDIVRATLDYEDDLEFFSKVITSLPKWNSLSSKQLITEIIKSRFNETNLHLSEMYWKNYHDGIEAEINDIE